MNYFVNFLMASFSSTFVVMVNCAKLFFDSTFLVSVSTSLRTNTYKINIC